MNQRLDANRLLMPIIDFGPALASIRLSKVFKLDQDFFLHESQMEILYVFLPPNIRYEMRSPRPFDHMQDGADLSNKEKW